MNTVADITNSTGSLDLTESGWDRRLQDWVHQVEVLDIQIEQTELQILGSERRREQALREVNIQQRSVEQATDVLQLLRDKFTNHAVYLFLQKYTADLYRQVYEIALREAREPSARSISNAGTPLASSSPATGGTTSTKVCSPASGSRWTWPGWNRSTSTATAASTN
jgi:ssRNA-specific RNase YbeY (16S rRNA maturation enzyme)